MASAYLSFPNGTREVPDGKWWAPASKYIISRCEQRAKDGNLRAGMVLGFTAGLFVGFVLIMISKHLDGTF